MTTKTKTIWKFPLILIEYNRIEMPVFAEILSVGVQNGTVCLWAIVEPDATKEERDFVICVTGNPVPANIMKFIGTVQMKRFVWHVFECDKLRERDDAEIPGYQTSAPLACLH